MSEQMPELNLERQEHGEYEPKAENLKPKTETEPDHNNEHKKVEAIRQSVAEHASKSSEIHVDHGAKISHKTPQHVGRQLKDEALQRSLNRVRKQLNAPQRVFSKAIHQPAVDALSKVGEQTIARPTGLLTGSILALVGSSYLLYSAKHYGYQYNYLSVILLFVGGYVLGLLIELLAHTLHQRSK